MKFNILIAESIPSLNKGEETIFQGILESLNFMEDVHVAMFSQYPEIDGPRYADKAEIIDLRQILPGFRANGYPNKYIQLVSSSVALLKHGLFAIGYKLFGTNVLKLTKRDIWKKYLEADVIIFGHNGTFCEGGGVGMPIVLHPIILPSFAKILGKPLILYGGSIKVKNVWYVPLLNVLYRFALNRVSLITLRESISHLNYKNLGVKNENCFLTTDLAFLMQPSYDNQRKRILEIEGVERSEKALIGITVTREKASIAFPNLNPSESYNEHVKMFAGVIDEITTKLNAKVIFIPHCIGIGERLDDRLVARDIYDLCTNKDCLVNITNEYNARDLKSLLGELDLFIGERVHSVINAMAMTTPSILISDTADQRLDIIRCFGQTDVICDIENLSRTQLLDKIYKVWNQRDSLKNTLLAQSGEARRVAERNTELFKKVVLNR